MHIPMAGVHPSTDTQDSHPRGTRHPQVVIMDPPRSTRTTSSIKGPTSITGRNFRARSSRDSWWKIYHTSMTKKKSPEEVCLLPQQYILHHQHSSSHPKTRKRDRDNRNSSTSPERRRRTSLKNTETISPRTTRRALQRTTSSFQNQSSQTSSVPSRTSFPQHPT